MLLSLYILATFKRVALLRHNGYSLEEVAFFYHNFPFSFTEARGDNVRYLQFHKPAQFPRTEMLTIRALYEVVYGGLC